MCCVRAVHLDTKLTLRAAGEANYSAMSGRSDRELSAIWKGITVPIRPGHG